MRFIIPALILSSVSMLCTTSMMRGQETKITNKLHTFESTDGINYDGYTYRRAYFERYVGSAYIDDAFPTHYFGWHGDYFGYIKIDPTQGAKGTGSSLKAAVTGGNPDGPYMRGVIRCGGPITSYEDMLEYPERVCPGRTNQSFYVQFFHSRLGWSGRSTFPQAFGANRMSFYLRLAKDFDQSIGGRVGDLVGEMSNINIGTYVIDPATQGSQPRNEDTHYYHFVALNGGGWIHVLLDQHPQHERGYGFDVGDNPTNTEEFRRRFGGRYSYYDGYTMFYIGDQNYTTRQLPWSVNIDEIEFYNTTNTPEPVQNDQTIASMAVGHYPEDNHWEINWYEPYRCDQCMGTFELRYSTEPITNANFGQATPVRVLRYGPSSSGISEQGQVRKQNPWTQHVWTRFELPNKVFANKKVYFAVRDISAVGQHCRGENYANSRCDNRNAPNNRIHTIDYAFSKSAYENPRTVPRRTHTRIGKADPRRTSQKIRVARRS